MTGPILAVMKAPEDPEQKKEWVKHIIRLQVAMWIDDKSKCSYCGNPYESVDNFLVRNPKRGFGDEQFVDTDCWASYKKLLAQRARIKKEKPE